MIGGQALVDALGPADQATVFAAVADITADLPTARSSEIQLVVDEVTERQRAERRVIPVSCTGSSPKLSKAHSIARWDAWL